MAKERCAFCGALNAPDAEWCGLCLRQFPPEEISVISSPADTEDTSDGPARGEQPGAEQSPRPPAAVAEPTARKFAPAQKGAFVVTETGITWKCERCETPNPLEAQVCSVCGTTFADVVRPKDTRPERDPNTAALVSLFLPGAGHMYLHLWPQGIARAIVNLWVAGVFLVAALAGGQSKATTLAVTFGAIATALWGINAHDAWREARSEGDQAILKGRIFLYLVLGLLMLLFILLVSAGLSARA